MLLPLLKRTHASYSPCCCFYYHRSTCRLAGLCGWKQATRTDMSFRIMHTAAVTAHCCGADRSSWEQKQQDTYMLYQHQSAAEESQTTACLYCCYSVCAAPHSPSRSKTTPRMGLSLKGGMSVQRSTPFISLSLSQSPLVLVCTRAQSSELSYLRPVPAARYPVSHDHMMIRAATTYIDNDIQRRSRIVYVIFHIGLLLAHALELVGYVCP